MLAISSLLAASYIVRLPASPPTACDYPTAAAAAASARALRHDARRIACVETETDDVLALKAELLDLLSEVQDRGVNGPPDLADDILEVATELDECDVGYDWARSPYLPGTWRLTYTSSRTFANNEGLTGYARDLAGVKTPELLMKVDRQALAKRLEYVEPVELEQGSFASLLGKFAGADEVRVECAWSEARDGAWAVTSQRVVVGSNSWQPADRQDKAVRALSAARPVYLDADLLVMRSNPEYIVWCFEKKK